MSFAFGAVLVANGHDDRFACWQAVMGRDTRASSEQALNGPEGADPQSTEALKAEIARRAKGKSR